MYIGMIGRTMKNRTKTLPKTKRPKVLIFDVETAPILAWVWGLWDQNVALNQIHTDWHIISWSAKWLDDPPSKIMYMDQRKEKNVENDLKLLKGIWKLLDEAEVVITQNGIKFDSKKLNARFILAGLGKPSPYKHIDTLKIAKKNFAFTSNKLEYMTDKLCTTYKKLTTDRKFSGFALWKECIVNNNLKAWKEMERYNKYDVLSLEELYGKLQPWDTSVNLQVFSDANTPTCNCGSEHFQRRGYETTAAGKYQRYQCTGCGKWHRGKENLLSVDKKKSMVVAI
jgi:hypothetical protein